MCRSRVPRKPPAPCRRPQAAVCPPPIGTCRARAPPQRSARRAGHQAVRAPAAGRRPPVSRARDRRAGRRRCWRGPASSPSATRTFCSWRYASGSRCAARARHQRQGADQHDIAPMEDEKRARRRERAGPVEQPFRIAPWGMQVAEGEVVRRDRFRVAALDEAFADRHERKRRVGRRRIAAARVGEIRQADETGFRQSVEVLDAPPRARIGGIEGQRRHHELRHQPCDARRAVRGPRCRPRP